MVRNGYQWALLYFGLGHDGHARDLIATGRSLTDFHQVSGMLIDVGAAGTIDEKYAHKPALIWHDGVVYHFYCAVSGKWPNDVRGLAVARSKPW